MLSATNTQSVNMMKVSCEITLQIFPLPQYVSDSILYTVYNDCDWFDDEKYVQLHG